MIKPRERLIVALDNPSIEETKELVERLGSIVSFYKIGIILAMKGGQALVEWLIKKDKKVFLDLKYFDVEDTIKAAVKNVASLGATFLTVHGNKKIIEAAVEGRGESPLKIISVSVLTSLDASDIKEMGFPCSIDELVLFRAKNAIKAGCDGVVTSGREVEKIKREIKNKLLIITPGIRPLGKEINSHKRWTTPSEAIKKGADYLVIGKPITKAIDPCKAAEDIIKEMEAAFLGR